MDTNTNPKLERLRKLLALSQNNTNIHEAQAAAAQAEKLAQELRIDLASMPSSAAEQEAVREDDDSIITSPHWDRILLGHLAAQYGCAIFTRIKHKNKCHVGLVGTSTDKAIVRTMFAYLCGEVDHLTKKNMRGATVTERKHYRLGVVRSVVETLRAASAEAIKQAEQTAVGTGAAIILKNRYQLAREEMYRRHPNMRSVKTRALNANWAYGAGVQDGRGINVGGARQLRLGSGS